MPAGMTKGPQFEPWAFCISVGAVYRRHVTLTQVRVRTFIAVTV